MSSLDQFLRVNEATEAVNTLKMLTQFLESKETGFYNLKWALITTHNSLQAFMVLVLRGSSNLGIIHMKKSYDGKNSYEILSDPNPRMLSFTELFAKIKGSAPMAGNPFIDKSGTITFSVKELNRSRNQFIHYLPMAWGLQVEYVLVRIEDTLKVIDFLIDDHRLVVHFTDEDKQELKDMVKRANKLINSYR